VEPPSLLIHVDHTWWRRFVFPDRALFSDHTVLFALNNQCYRPIID
jgi:hypothetical protein